MGRVRVTISEDGLNIANPGGFIEGVSIKNLLTAEPHGRNPLGDQDIIVRILNDETAELDRCWNFLSQYILYGRREKPAIYHFSGNTLGRPWFTSSKHPIREAYRQVAAEAGLPEVAEQVKAMPLEYKIQYWLYKILPGFAFRPVCSLMLRTHIKLTYGI